MDQKNMLHLMVALTEQSSWMQGLENRQVSSGGPMRVETTLFKQERIKVHFDHVLSNMWSILIPDIAGRAWSYLALDQKSEDKQLRTLQVHQPHC